jgi:hypothetical protein
VPRPGSRLPAELRQEARVRVAEQQNPALSETAQLSAAYTYAIGTVQQTLIVASGMSHVELDTDPTRVRDTRRPYLMSTGEEA